jgi:hypothetical protein
MNTEIEEKRNEMISKDKLKEMFPGYSEVPSPPPQSRARVSCAGLVCGSRVRVSCAGLVCRSRVQVSCAGLVCDYFLIISDYLYKIVG